MLYGRDMQHKQKRRQNNNKIPPSTKELKKLLNDQDTLQQQWRVLTVI